VIDETEAIVIEAVITDQAEAAAFDLLNAMNAVKEVTTLEIVEIDVDQAEIGIFFSFFFFAFLNLLIYIKEWIEIVIVVEIVVDETVVTVIDVIVIDVIREVTQELEVIPDTEVILDHLNQEVIQEDATIQIILEDLNEIQEIVDRQEIIQEDIQIIIPSLDLEVHRFVIVTLK
jgi:hypothetical protein